MSILVGGLALGGTCPEGAEPLREYVRVVDRPYRQVGLTVTVTDRQGGAVRGLARDDFRVYEDGEEMVLSDFGVEGDRTDRPLSVAILLDLSQSMGRQVKKVRQAAQSLLAGLRPEFSCSKRTSSDATIASRKGSASGEPPSVMTVTCPPNA